MDRRMFSLFTTCMLVLAVCLLPAAGEAGQPRRHTVLIDPAHGGEDSGVVADKLREKDITLRIALLIQEEAQKAENLQVRLTRNADRALTADERITAAGDHKPECLISLHVNAGFGKQASGYEVYFPGFIPEGSREGGSSPILKDMARNRSLNDSVRLAQQIQSALETVFPRKGRGLREAPNALLSGLNVPGLVVEIGFATHPEERQRLTGEAAQRAVARALVKGLREYFRTAP
ncbi:MAG: N-acetylmuramoyl-L-alanine amidase family protein [Syntrophales bacterium]